MPAEVVRARMASPNTIATTHIKAQNSLFIRCQLANRRGLIAFGIPPAAPPQAPRRNPQPANIGIGGGGDGQPTSVTSMTELGNLRRQ
jgi:hypothetical protein